MDEIKDQMMGPALLKNNLHHLGFDRLSSIRSEFVDSVHLYQNSSGHSKIQPQKFEVQLPCLSNISGLSPIDNRPLNSQINRSQSILNSELLIWSVNRLDLLHRCLPESFSLAININLFPSFCGSINGLLSLPKINFLSEYFK
jgi:hypothetical protein